MAKNKRTPQSSLQEDLFSDDPFFCMSQQQSWAPAPRQSEKKKSNAGLIALIASVGAVVLLAAIFAAVYFFVHFGGDPTCLESGNCVLCGKEQAPALGHNWQNASCTDPRSCSRCGITDGSALGHDWQEATCTQPHQCSRCASVQAPALGHNWRPASYYLPETCLTCGATQGSPVPLGQIPQMGMVAAGGYHSVFLRPNGTVYGKGCNEKSKYVDHSLRLEITHWDDIVCISAGNHTVAVKSTGRVYAAGENRYGQCDVASWRDIVSVAAGLDHTVGLRSDGTVVATGKNNKGQCDVWHWQNIVQVAVRTDTTYGLTADGRVLAAGAYINSASDWTDIKAIYAGPYHLVGIKEDGTVVASGKFDSWDGRPDEWTDIVAVSLGSAHAIGLKSDGTVVGCGSTKENKGQWDVSGWENVAAISCGIYHSIAVTFDGRILAVGSNGWGQLAIQTD